ncbi:vgrG protein [alpha proteobacterium U9-1i]|nr:vgrG protein [alpha proteobacterium U9-1i]
MGLFERRPLTAGEIGIGKRVFGDEIDWPRVRVFQGPPLGFGAMVPRGRTIVFSKWRAARDFTRANANEQGWLVHELMHVWQAAHGKVLAISKLGALGSKAYAYSPKAGVSLRKFNIESQAEIARHLYLARLGAPESGAPDKQWLEQVWSTR